MEDLNFLRLLSVLLTLELLSLCNGTGSSAKPDCPIKITPSSMVIEYQSTGQNATCEPISKDSKNIVRDVYWQANGINITDGRSWLVDTNKDWNPRPVCTATFTGRGKCQKELNFILYKTPDSVSVCPVDNSSSVVEGQEFQLQCDITNVAPAGNLTVRWYRGDKIIGTTNASILSENSTDDNSTAVRHPVNMSSNISVTLNRTHNGAEFKCESVLNLGPDRPQINNMSSPLNITVHYKPIINATKLPKIIPVFRGYPEELVCEADGHPPPEIDWHHKSEKVQRFGNTLRVFEAGFYTCNATNNVDSSTLVVKVILKEDYLPLIAGFVAVTVVAISIVFLFIYSIYYKNTRMRRYSLKNPKLNNHNGNVAHNGWDMQFPMTKLS